MNTLNNVYLMFNRYKLRLSIFVFILCVINISYKVYMLSHNVVEPEYTTFKAKIIKYSDKKPYVTSGKVCVIYADSTYDRNDTVLWNNQRYVIISKYK